MATVLETIKGRLGLGPTVAPKEAVNTVANIPGGKFGNARDALRGRQSQIDAAVNESLGMPPPKGQK